MARVKSGAFLSHALIVACAVAFSIRASSAPALPWAGGPSEEVGMASNALVLRESPLPKSAEPARQRLKYLIGAADLRVPGPALTDKVAEAPDYEIFAIRWRVFDRVHGEGLWLKAKKPPQRLVVAIPDAEQTPEMAAGLVGGIKPELQFARRLAENGCDVLVPVLIRRAQRAEVCREGSEAQHHIIGYEVQKVLAAVDWFKTLYPAVPVAAVGYGEGGLVALYAAALDTRIGATLVCGYFDRHRSEPNYRRAPGLTIGDAEIASLIAPRALLVEYSVCPALSESRSRRPAEPNYDAINAEFERAQALVKERGQTSDRFEFISGNEGMLTGPVGELALNTLLRQSGVSTEMKDPGPPPEDTRQDFDPAERQSRQRKELLDYSRQLLFWRQIPPLWRY